MSSGLRATEAARGHLAELGQANGAEIRLQNVPTGDFRQPGKDRGICDGLETGQLPSSEQAHTLSFAGAPEIRGIRGAGVRGGELKSVGAEVIAAPQPDGEAAFGQLAILLELAHLVARALQSGEGLGTCPGIDVAASSRVVKLCCGAGQDEKERRAENQ